MRLLNLSQRSKWRHRSSAIRRRVTGVSVLDLSRQRVALIFKGRNVKENIAVLKNKATTLYRNVENWLNCDAAIYPRRINFSYVGLSIRLLFNQQMHNIWRWLFFSLLHSYMFRCVSNVVSESLCMLMLPGILRCNLLLCTGIIIIRLQDLKSNLILTSVYNSRFYFNNLSNFKIQKPPRWWRLRIETCRSVIRRKSHHQILRICWLNKSRIDNNARCTQFQGTRMFGKHFNNLNFSKKVVTI